MLGMLDVTLIKINLDFVGIDTYWKPHFNVILLQFHRMDLRPSTGLIATNDSGNCLPPLLSVIQRNK